MVKLASTPLTAKQTEIYRRLWHLSDDIVDVDKPVVRVRYEHIRFRATPDGSGAIFMLELDGKFGPRIWIKRPLPLPAQASVADPEGAGIGELLSLAHERGHERSWRLGSYKAMTMPEEHRAWVHAKAILTELGFEGEDDWDVFERSKEYSLECHRKAGTPETE